MTLALDPATVLGACLDFDKVDAYLQQLKKLAEQIHSNGAGSLSQSITGVPEDEALWKLLQTFSTVNDLLLKTREKLNERVTEVQTGVKFLQRTVRASVQVAALKTMEKEQEQANEKRKNIVVELLETERTYIKSLQKMIDKTSNTLCFESRFREISRKNNLDSQHDPLWDGIFGNISEILLVNQRFFVEIEKVVQNWSKEQSLADLFIQWSQHFFVYSNFASKYQVNESNIEKITKEKPFVSEKTLISEFRACYITPIQRLPRYELLLSDLRRNTPTSLPEYEKLAKAIESVKQASQKINSDVRRRELDDMTKTIQKNVHPGLVTGRQLSSFLRAKFIHETIYTPAGEKTREHKEGHVFLFDDVVVSDRIFSATFSRGFFDSENLPNLEQEDSVMLVPSIWIATNVAEDSLKELGIDTSEVLAINCCIIFDGRRKWIVQSSDGKAGINSFIESCLTIFQCTEQELANGVRKPGKFVPFPGKGEYCGWMKNGKPHGTGMFKQTSGNIFKGVWDEELDVGYGKVIKKKEGIQGNDEEGLQLTGWVCQGLGSVATCQELYPERCYSFWAKEKLTKSDWEVLLYGSTVVKLEANSPIISVGEHQTNIYKVRTGSLLVEGPNNLTWPVESGIVGISGIVGKSVFMKCTTSSPTELYCIPYQALIKLAIPSKSLSVGLAYTALENAATNLVEFYSAKMRSIPTRGGVKIQIQGITAVYPAEVDVPPQSVEKQLQQSPQTKKLSSKDLTNIERSLTGRGGPVLKRTNTIEEEDETPNPSPSSPTSPSAPAPAPLPASISSANINSDSGKGPVKKKDKSNEEKKFRKRFNLVKETEVLINSIPARLAGKTGFGILYLSTNHLCLYVDALSVTKISIHFADISLMSAGTDISVKTSGDKQKMFRFEYKDPQAGAQFSRIVIGLWELFSQQKQEDTKLATKSGGVRDRTVSGHVRVKSISRVRRNAKEAGKVEIPLSDILGEKEFQLLEKYAETEEFKDKQVIVREGEVNSRLMKIVEGHCDFLLPVPGTGHYTVVNTVKTGKFIAECCNFQGKSPVTIVARGNVVLQTIKADFVNLLFAKFGEDLAIKFFSHMSVIVFDRLEFLMTGKETPIINHNKTTITKIQTTMTALGELSENQDEEIAEVIGEDDEEESESDSGNRGSGGFKGIPQKPSHPPPLPPPVSPLPDPSDSPRLPPAQPPPGPPSQNSQPPSLPPPPTPISASSSSSPSSPPDSSTVENRPRQKERPKLLAKASLLSQQYGQQNQPQNQQESIPTVVDNPQFIENPLNENSVSAGNEETTIEDPIENHFGFSQIPNENEFFGEPNVTDVEKLDSEMDDVLNSPFFLSTTESSAYVEPTEFGEITPVDNTVQEQYYWPDENSQEYYYPDQQDYQYQYQAESFPQEDPYVETQIPDQTPLHAEPLLPEPQNFALPPPPEPTPSPQIPDPVPPVSTQAYSKPPQRQDSVRALPMTNKQTPLTNSQVIRPNIVKSNPTDVPVEKQEQVLLRPSQIKQQDLEKAKTQPEKQDSKPSPGFATKPSQLKLQVQQVQQEQPNTVKPSLIKQQSQEKPEEPNPAPVKPAQIRQNDKPDDSSVKQSQLRQSLEKQTSDTPEQNLVKPSQLRQQQQQNDKQESDSVSVKPSQLRQQPSIEKPNDKQDTPVSVKPSQLRQQPSNERPNDKQDSDSVSVKPSQLKQSFGQPERSDSTKELPLKPSQIKQPQEKQDEISPTKVKQASLDNEPEPVSVKPSQLKQNQQEKQPEKQDTASGLRPYQLKQQKEQDQKKEEEKKIDEKSAKTNSNPSVTPRPIPASGAKLESKVSKLKLDLAPSGSSSNDTSSSPAISTSSGSGGQSKLKSLLANFEGTESTETPSTPKAALPTSVSRTNLVSPGTPKPQTPRTLPTPSGTSVVVTAGPKPSPQTPRQLPSQPGVPPKTPGSAGTPVGTPSTPRGARGPGNQDMLAKVLNSSISKQQ